KGEDLVPDGGAEGAGRLLGLGAPAEQVGPGEVADQQGPAGQQQRGLVRRGVAVVDEQADVLGDVPGRVQDLYADLADLELLPVAQRPVRVAEAGRRRADRRRAGAGRELPHTGDVVVVAVGVQRVPDAQPPVARQRQVVVDVAPGVEHQRLAGLLRPQQI